MATTTMVAERPTRVRWAIIALIFVISSINYADRASFGIAGSSASQELGLSAVATGFILSAFGWSYVGAQIPSGALLDRYGTRPVYFGAILLWSMFTFFQGFAGLVAGLSAITMLFALRFLVGLAEAPSSPANSRIVAAWFPAAERGTASAIFNSSQYFSLVAFAPLMGWVVHEHGWRAVFYVMGALGIVAALVFWKFIRDPVSHPNVNAAEVRLIEEGGGLTALDQTAKAGRGTFTWHNIRQLLANRMMVGIYVGQYGINVLTYFFVTWFPIYLVKERGFNILEAGFAAALPAVAGFVGGVLGGVISDWLLRRTGSLTFARKAPLVVGMVMASAIIGCVYVEQEWLVVGLMTLAFFGKGIASLGWAIMSDVAPRELAGLAGGVFNMFGNTAGIVTPIVIGYLVQDSGSFDTSLIFVGAHCALVIVAFLAAGPIARLTLTGARG